MKKLHIFTLLLLFALLLTSCVGQLPTENPAVSSSEQGSQNAEASSDSTTTETPDNTPTYISLVQDKTSAYTIMRSEDASEALKAAVTQFRVDLSNATGASFKIGTDWVRPNAEVPTGTLEILVGETNRPESIKARAMIREKDFIIYEENDRVVILGGNDDSTLRAIEYFLTVFVLTPENKTVTLQKGQTDIVKHSYSLGLIKVGDVDLRDYTVVIPAKNCPLYTKYAAYNLIDYLKSEAGITLALSDDSKPASAHEIVIGDTSRPGSASAKAAVKDKTTFVLKESEGSIYMYGQSYMVGGAVSEFLNNYIKADKAGQDVKITGLPTADTAKTFVFPEKASASILLIGDGMGFNHIEKTIAAGLDSFVAKELPNAGKAVTASQSVLDGKASYTDSAASATALATGYKTNNNYLGVTAANKSIQNVRELASQMGARTSILTTDVITGATPSGFLCHYKSRTATATLQEQIDKELETDKNLLYATSVKNNQDTLVTEARKHLYALAEGGNTKFFTMIEEAYIDKHSHNNDFTNMMKTTRRYNDLIAYVVQFVLIHPSTALVITADHECGGITSNTTGQTFNFTSKNHTNADVPVFAIGPGTEYFNGETRDNTAIAKFLARAFSANAFGDSSIRS